MQTPCACVCVWHNVPSQRGHKNNHLLAIILTASLFGGFGGMQNPNLIGAGVYCSPACTESNVALV